jgi:hypothetical protein
MLPLDSPAWADLDHAYGEASDVPDLLDLTEQGDEEAEEELWAALWHEGEVFTASYAALPHLIRMVASESESVSIWLLYLVARIETSRLADLGPPIPENLRGPYQRALRSIPTLAARLLERPRSEESCRIIFAAIASYAGHPALGTAITRLSPEGIEALNAALDE